MKKTVLVGFGIAILLAAAFWADKKFPAGGKQSARITESNEIASVENVPIKDLQDHDVTLAEYKGKVVLVNFWATWCALPN
jgi:thiol-disulfide isomerase/thioredoxin